MKVLAYGEILWDLIDGHPYLGGAPFNFAAHFARCGNQAFLVSSVGNDNLGWRALSDARRLNVDCTYVKMHPQAPTGTVDVYLNQGEPDYTITENVAFDDIVVDGDLFLDPAAFDIMYMGTLSQRKRISENTLRRILAFMKFKHVFYDVNLRKGGWNSKLLNASASACTILKMNVNEVPEVSLNVLGEQLEIGEFCKQITYKYKNISVVIITAAADGCFVFDRRQLTHIPGFPVNVVDSIGAGDAFSAVFMHIYGTTKDPLHAGTIANRIGAFVASSRGAIPDYPNEILETLKMAKSS